MTPTYTFDNGTDRFQLSGERVSRIWIRQMRGLARQENREQIRATLVGLRLGRIGKVSVLADTSETRGMIRKVSHLVKVIIEDHGPLPEPGGFGTSTEGVVAQAALLAAALAKLGTITPSLPKSKSNAPRAGTLVNMGKKAAHYDEGHVGSAFADARAMIARAKASGEGMSEALRQAGRALRSAPASEMEGKGDTMQRRLERERIWRQNTEFDLLDLLFSEDRDVAWQAACQVARSFEDTRDAFRFTRDGGDLSKTDEGRVLEAVVEVLQARGHRFFSLLKFTTIPKDDARVVMRGRFTLSLAADFGPGRSVCFPKFDMSKVSDIVSIYADGGVKATKVTKQKGLREDDAIFLDNDFEVEIPADQAAQTTQVTFVVPGFLADCVELEPRQPA